ncbi:low molecular weight phosphatase family protein [Natrononativus amylolyticus]|uniref:arsenate-mycothiol transferase ArsC n=1 Tax=Natrononativus amylolyticus TaxID=2963434 RepID=UPI0020CC4860|nr:low molecular weight phosphatase family protein [Natrononativus amylolyticus]
MTKIAFVCVGNAGRSQMATAFAERERDRRDLADEIELVTGGTDPRDHVHEAVVEALAEVGIDVGDRSPRTIADEDLIDADYVVTMGCDAADVAPNGWTGTAEQWDVSHPDGDDAVRAQRDEIDRRVVGLFDRIASDGDAE